MTARLFHSARVASMKGMSFEFVVCRKKASKEKAKEGIGSEKDFP